MRYVFCFDGTGNNATNAEESVPGMGDGWDDEGITNIAKIHLLLGGNFKNDGIPVHETTNFYY